MKQSEMGRVMPFGMSGMQLRRSAQQYRRWGQTLEALSLVRRAAEQDDTAAAWQAVAAELRQMSCWESAAAVLSRVLSREDMPVTAWLDMARCLMAMGQQDAAEDCLYHLLQEEPWIPEADAAREMLRELTLTREETGPARTLLLTQRAMTAWQRGDRKLALRRLRRAIRLSPKKARLMTTIALLYMMIGDGQQALRWFSKAMKCEPQEPAVPCSMAALLHQMGRPRIACGLLRKAALLCADPVAEERFCTTAWSMDAWPELADFLQQRLKHTPHRIPLLQAKATMLHEQGSHQEAQDVWRLILSIDPCDRRASTLLCWTQMNPGMMLSPGRLPATTLAMQQKQLKAPGADLFRCGSEGRRVLDWCVASQDGTEQQLAFDTAKQHPDKAGESRWLRELLMRSDVQEPLRQRVLMRLAELEHFEPVNVLLGNRFVSAQCQPLKTSLSKRLWHSFLPAMLRMAVKYPQPHLVVAFAAQTWPMLTPAERQEAATSQPAIWSRLLLVLFLIQEGQSQRAAAEMQQLHMPARRIQRMITRFLTMLENQSGSAGEGDTER